MHDKQRDLLKGRAALDQEWADAERFFRASWDDPYSRKELERLWEKLLPKTLPELDEEESEVVSHFAYLTFMELLQRTLN